MPQNTFTLGTVDISRAEQNYAKNIELCKNLYHQLKAANPAAMNEVEKAITRDVKSIAYEFGAASTSENNFTPPTIEINSHPGLGDVSFSIEYYFTSWNEKIYRGSFIFRKEEVILRITIVDINTDQEVVVELNISGKDVTVYCGPKGHVKTLTDNTEKQKWLEFFVGACLGKVSSLQVLQSKETRTQLQKPEAELISQNASQNVNSHIDEHEVSNPVPTIGQNKEAMIPKATPEVDKYEISPDEQNYLRNIGLCSNFYAQIIGLDNPNIILGPIMRNMEKHHTYEGQYRPKPSLSFSKDDPTILNMGYSYISSSGKKYEGTFTFSRDKVVLREMHSEGDDMDRVDIEYPAWVSELTIENGQVTFKSTLDDRVKECTDKEKHDFLNWFVRSYLLSVPEFQKLQSPEGRAEFQQEEASRLAAVHAEHHEISAKYSPMLEGAFKKLAELTDAEGNLPNNSFKSFDRKMRGYQNVLQKGDYKKASGAIESDIENLDKWIKKYNEERNSATKAQEPNATLIIEETPIDLPDAASIKKPNELPPESPINQISNSVATVSQDEEIMMPKATLTDPAGKAEVLQAEQHHPRNIELCSNFYNKLSSISSDLADKILEEIMFSIADGYHDPKSVILKLTKSSSEISISYNYHDEKKNKDYQGTFTFSPGKFVLSTSSHVNIKPPYVWREESLTIQNGSITTSNLTLDGKVENFTYKEVAESLDNFVFFHLKKPLSVKLQSAEGRAELEQEEPNAALIIEETPIDLSNTASIEKPNELPPVDGAEISQSEQNPLLKIVEQLKKLERYSHYASDFSSVAGAFDHYARVDHSEYGNLEYLYTRIFKDAKVLIEKIRDSKSTTFTEASISMYLKRFRRVVEIYEKDLETNTNLDAKKTVTNPQRESSEPPSQEERIDVTVDSIKAAIATFRFTVNIYSSKNKGASIPTAYKVLTSLETASEQLEELKNNPDKYKENAILFQQSCREALAGITDRGLDKEPWVGDGLNKVLTAIINALNHLISIPKKIWDLKASSTFFRKREDTSPELRRVFEEIIKIPEVIELSLGNPGNRPA